MAKSHLALFELPHSVRDLINLSLQHVGLENRFDELVKVDNNLLRTKDVKTTIGDSRKIKESLGWEKATSECEPVHEHNEIAT